MKKKYLIGFFVLAASLSVVLSCSDKQEALNLPSLSEIDSKDRNPYLDITRDPAIIPSFQTLYTVPINSERADILLERLMDDLFWPFISNAGGNIAYLISSNTSYVPSRSVIDSGEFIFGFSDLVNNDDDEEDDDNDIHIPDNINLVGFVRGSYEETDSYFRASGETKFRLELEEGAILDEFIGDTVSAMIGNIAGQGSGKIRITEDEVIESGNISISVNGAVNLGVDIYGYAKCTFAINITGSFSKRNSNMRVSSSIRLFGSGSTALATYTINEEIDILDFFDVNEL